ncbi:YqgE/AlgH family protein [Salinispora pacifica]|uniref:YqgE/AlgH family protein n=1 Tax=Salinispora pacifica TaxID=351187 RepID=UPI0002E32AD3|nr:YqgE/AlgH family protein [Salinispora pacifica]
MSDMQEEGRAIGGQATESMAGRLLVAAPTLKDPNFDRTVVLLVAHEPGGALGVVLNRATEIPVAEVLGDWGELARDPAVVFEGGPVQPDSAICLARMRHPLRPMKSFQQISGAVGTLDLTVDPEQLRESIVGIRVFAGYSGWESGQLEQEIAEGSWFVLDALPGDAFVDRPDDLWPMVLRRQGGMMAAVAHFPADVALN